MRIPFLGGKQDAPSLAWGDDSVTETFTGGNLEWCCVENTLTMAVTQDFEKGWVGGRWE